MSIATVVTRGYSVGSANLVVTRGYGIGAAVVVVPPTNIVSAGGNLFPSKKRKTRVIRYSDYETREAYERALLEALPIHREQDQLTAIPMSEVRSYPTMERTLADEEEEEEVIFMLLKLLH